MTKAYPLILVAACSAALALAQENPSNSDPVNFSAAARLDYTDNRDSTEADKESTLDTYISPRIDINATGERSKLTFYYVPSMRYRENPSPSQNDWELLHDLGLVASHDLTQLTSLRLNEFFSYQDDPAISEQGSQVRSDESYIMNRVEGGVRHNFNPRTYADVLARNMIKRYTEDSVAAESDQDTTEGILTLWRQLTRSTAMHGVGSASMFGYESDIGLERDFDMLAIGIGLDHVFSPEFRGSIEGGAQSTEYADDSIDSGSDPYGKIDVVVSPAPTFRINGGLGTGVRGSDVYPFASQEYAEFRGGAELDASEIVLLGLDLVYRESKYNGDKRPANAPAPLPGRDLEGNETTTVVGGRIEWKLRDSSRIMLRQVYEDVDSDVEETFVKNTTTAELNVDF